MSLRIDSPPLRGHPEWNLGDYLADIFDLSTMSAVSRGKQPEVPVARIDVDYLIEEFLVPVASDQEDKSCGKTQPGHASQTDRLSYHSLLESKKTTQLFQCQREAHKRTGRCTSRVNTRPVVP